MTQTGIGGTGDVEQIAERQKGDETHPLVVSLGCRCDVAWQIRRRFNISKAFPFHWLVTPITAITRLLTEGFDRITDDLEAVQYHASGWTIYNPDYRLYLHHDFPRLPSGEMACDWRSHTRHIAGKYSAIGKRFLDTLAEAPAVTFIRRAGDFEMPGERRLPTAQNQITELLDSLQARMTSVPRLILLNCPTTSSDSRIITDQIDLPSAEEMPDRSLSWRGSSIGYDALFRRHL